MTIQELQANNYFKAWPGDIEGSLSDLQLKDQPLGNPDGWPIALKATVDTVFASPFPMHLCLGEQKIQIYNEAFGELLRRTGRTDGLWMPLKASFSERWELIQPVLDKVMSGISVKAMELHLPSGKDTSEGEVYLDLYLSPARDDSGNVAGVLTNVVETTKAVIAKKQLECLRAELQELADTNALQREMLVEFLINSPTSVCILDGERLVFEFVNPVYQALFPGRELLGKSLVDALPELADDPIMEILAEVMRLGKAFYATDRLVPSARTSQGEIEDRYFDFSYHPRLDQHGRANGVLVYAIEVTERRKRELGAKDCLELVGGEILKPLGSLHEEISYIGKSSLVLSEDDKSLPRLLNRADAHLRQISHMINTYLNLSTLSAGKLQLSISSFDLEKLISEMVEMQPDSSVHTLAFAKSGVKMVRADRSRIRYVVGNLLASAIKYSPAGGEILIECRLAGRFTEVMVKDTGLGVRAHTIEQVFHYLNYEVISAHGGRIWVKKTPGASSSFYFSLPN